MKRLLRVDNEAVSMKWEVITEEGLNADKGGEAGKDNLIVKPSVSGSTMIRGGRSTVKGQPVDRFLVFTNKTD